MNICIQDKCYLSNPFFCLEFIAMQQRYINVISDARSSKTKMTKICTNSVDGNQNRDCVVNLNMVQLHSYRGASLRKASDGHLHNV